MDGLRGKNIPTNFHFVTLVDKRSAVGLKARLYKLRKDLPRFHFGLDFQPLDRFPYLLADVDRN